jgi:acyl-CoA thioesterase-1
LNAAEEGEMDALIYEKKSVVFIGDSITDCGRTYPTVSEYGRGFAAMCIAQLQAEYPGAVLYNRGIAGECIGQVYQRWNSDCLALNPGLVSLLIGINDVDYSYRRADHPFDEAVLAGQLEEMFRSVKKIGARLVVMEPNAFDGELYRDEFYPRLHWLQQTTFQLAKVYADVYIPNRLTKALTVEGVHPTDEGHRFLAEQWMNAVRAGNALDFL